MKSLTRDRWEEVCRSIGAQGDIVRWYNQLLQLYAEPQRHYHNCRHIAECLDEFDSARHLAKQPLAVELAIWFHDAIYNPSTADNEERSAELATQFIAEARAEPNLRQSVYQLVLATKQHDSSLHPDASLMVDVDLSIFGQPPERFWEYETQIRAEYNWVPEKLFAEKRAEILQRFLSRNSIYSTALFRGKYERQARVNLHSSVQRLLHGRTDATPGRTHI